MSNTHTPFSELKVYIEVSGTGTFYSIKNNEIKVYNISEINGLETKLHIQ